MKRILISIIVLVAMATSIQAETLPASEPLKLQPADMSARLVVPEAQTNTPGYKTLMPVMAAPAPSATDVKYAIKPYKFMDDMTFVGVPLFVAGIIAKSEKKSFRQDYDNTGARSRLVKYNFHNELDNYTQFAPMFLSTGLNVAGVEGRSNFWRYLANGAMSYAIMAAIVNPIKYTAKEMRPDGSTRNSWPSGHTATAFVSATILHKEYGLTRSPWYSVFGYSVATATGVMRVLNNRHWVSDVLSGAGIGIFSTELAYGLGDLLFKERGLKRNDLPNTANIIENPSFFSVSMGVGLGSKSLDFDGEELEVDDDVNLKFQASTVVGAEGAWFFNRHVGIGGRLRVTSSPVKGWDAIYNKQQENMNSWIEEQYDEYPALTEMIQTGEMTIESDHITEFAADLGLYFNFPLSSRFALGTKLLVGRSIIQDLDINAHFTGLSVDVYDKNGNKIENPGFGDIFDETTDLKSGSPYDTSWDYFTVSGNNTMKYGTGISLTYAYKSQFSWRVFVDYDFTRKTYTMTYAPNEYLKQAYPACYNAFEGEQSYNEQEIKKNMNSFVIGGAFCVSF